MEKIKILEGPLTFGPDNILGLTDAQAHVRQTLGAITRHGKNGVYRVLKQVEFITGEEIGFEGEIPKAYLPLIEVNGKPGTEFIKPDEPTPVDIPPAPEPAKEETKDKAAGMSKAVKELLDKNDLDPAEIVGTGKEGRITVKDVTAHLAALEESADENDPADPPADPAEVAGEESDPSGDAGDGDKDPDAGAAADPDQDPADPPGLLDETRG